MAFCIYCLQDVDANTIECADIKVVKNTPVQYTKKICICPVCGEEIYVPEIGDANIQAVYDAYRQAEGLISYARVLELSKKYDISKRNFSRILGWGEHTFENFCKGYIPTAQFSDEMERLFDEDYFVKILNRAYKNGEIQEKVYTHALNSTKTKKLSYGTSKYSISSNIIVKFSSCYELAA